jgi:hypothetical protein
MTVAKYIIQEYKKTDAEINLTNYFSNKIGYTFKHSFRGLTFQLEVISIHEGQVFFECESYQRVSRSYYGVFSLDISTLTSVKGTIEKLMNLIIESRTVYLVEVHWDLDNPEEDEYLDYSYDELVSMYDLPYECEIECSDEDMIADALSDKYGWCVNQVNVLNTDANL